MIAFFILYSMIIFLSILINFIRGNIISFVSLFSIGFLYYITIPILAYTFNLYKEGPAYDYWIFESQEFYESSTNIYIIYSIFIFITFFLFSKIKIKTKSILSKFNRPIDKKIIFTTLSAIIIVWFYFLYQARGLIGAGYLMGYDPTIMGPLATINLVVTLLLLNILHFEKENNKNISKKILFSLLFANSLFLLSMGGRMYVLCSFIALSIYFLNKKNSPKERLKFLFFSMIISLILIIVGIYRVGEALSISHLFNFFIAESLLTSITIPQLYQCFDLKLFDFSSSFTSSILNFIPSSLFPTKSDYIIDFSDGCITSPLGATHIGAALLGNFGIIGSFIFITFFSLILNTINSVNKKGWWLSNYLFSLIPFMFFRDGFVIFNKSFIFTGIFIGLFLIFISRFKWH